MVPVFFAAVYATVDCVRVITSPTGGAAAVAELTRIGFRDVSVGRLPLLSAHSGRSSPAGERAHKRGCYTAHVAAHAWAVSRNCTSTLIVEDDVVFSGVTAAEISSAVSSLESAGQFETLWLGYHASSVVPLAGPAGLAELRKPMLSHAVVFSAAASARIAALPRWRRRATSIYEAYDVALWHDASLRAHGVYPPVAGQRSSGKSLYLDWSKSLSGQRALGVFSYNRCSRVFGSYASRVAQLVGLFMTLPDDAYSLIHAYRCAD